MFVALKHFVFVVLLSNNDCVWYFSISRGLKKIFFSILFFMFRCQLMIVSGVSVPPGTPDITSDLSGGVYQEGQTVRFTCSSSGGNPPPTITWMKNGVGLLNIAAGQTTTERGTTRNVLSVTMDHSDHQANYTCFVYNTVNENSPHIAYTILNVRCE